MKLSQKAERIELRPQVDDVAFRHPDNNDMRDRHLSTRRGHALKITLVGATSSHESGDQVSFGDLFVYLMTEVGESCVEGSDKLLESLSS